MYRRWVYALLVGVILLVYLSTLHRYGTAIPAAMPPEEISFAGLSRSIAEGKGIVFAIPSEIVPSPAETPRPFLMPVVSYALALSGWGSILGFDLLPLRWFNRILGVLNLLLLILLARRWGVPRGLALLAAFWTSMDIAYQMVSNMVRSDMFSLFGILLGLWAFTQGQQRGGARWWAASGACLALALFAHFWQGFYITAWLALALLWNRRWKGLAAFLIPIVAAGLLWLLFVLQDWSWFLFLSRLMVLDKTPPGWPTLVWLSGVHVITNLLGIYPSNSPLWIAVLSMLAWAWFRRHLNLPFWQWGLFWVAYGAAYINPHPWYVGWFTPFGYLALALFGSQVVLPLARGRAMRILIVLVLLWTIYQAIQVGRCWQAAPTIHQAHQQFFQELAEELPPNESFWLHSVPDPSFSLYKSRPDLTLYVGTGYFTCPDFFQRLDDIIIVPSRIPLSALPPHHVRREWIMPGVLYNYPIRWLEPLR